MATVNTKYTKTEGRNGFTSYHSLFDGANDHDAAVVVDLSADGAEGHTNSITVQKVKVLCTAGIDCTLEFDGDTDEDFATTILGSIAWYEVDFTEFGMSGARAGPDKNATGDIVVTTTSAASADELIILIWWRSS